jgi:hypothetical protein
VSSHFIVSKSGQIVQMVDTNRKTWAQRDGNSQWLSVENEGFLPNPLTSAQIAANAKILAKANKVYGVPLQVTNTPKTRGLGHHSMGAENGLDWGHSACPGPAIKAQKPAIVAGAKLIVMGVDVTPAELVKLLTDPTCAPTLRALAWQYVGGGIDTGMSTLGVLNAIHQNSKKIGAVDLTDEQLSVIADKVADKVGATLVEQIAAAVVNLEAQRLQS